MQDDTEKKLSHKGVPKYIEFEDQHYLRCLYDDEPGKVSYGNIKISKKQCVAKTCSITKRALNGLYMKFYVEEDRVSIRPHILDGQYI